MDYLYMIEDPFILHLISEYRKPAFIDEVGMGSVFGNLVSCAVMLPDLNYRLEGVNDSKQLKNQEIYRLADTLKEKVIYSFGIVEPDELNEIKNMYKANLLAMTRAVYKLPEKPDALFIDGKFNPNTGITTYPIVKGDEKVFGIAVASIIAKEYRDSEIIICYGEKYKKYGISSNKGYRSPRHLMSIKKWGLTPFHRAWQPVIKRVINGDYDEVIQSKYKKVWDSISK